ncbi:ShlB/FhaC/HecB family hemolysin secretion/activation protein [Janthinobacterium agaricidamnosum]|uniref:POTRA domain, ShlB-type family protein n=1 Tax=Janthinobacterium agaricidamnosum NBRC 102515 = DSM 9628 TaxID=1349767 RepID=W0V2K0_9BURK|nr:ShlB/FhaC/HecB family hemolysin secretion/activation protein [Janthinobacterium agaricidamnosum]CDG82106.1 POTRA domain, ShlB-type family protein [Janthinobacterium agaricidamnosum NBRC 102515 = DSM 9628]
MHAVDPPGAGSQIQQIPQAPQLKKAAPEIRIQQGNTPVAAVGDNTRISVKSLRIAAPPGFTEAELIAASGFTPGSELTLAELRGLAGKIADYYHVRGYFLAQAYLPAQDIHDGAVTIAVLAGQYGKVSLRNQSGLSDGLANQLLAGLDDKLIATGPLERRLLLLSDLPGVQVSSTLAPGASLGASDLIVDVAPGARVNGSIDADNQGNRYTGRNRIGATVNINELAGLGDVATVRAFTSTDGLNYGRAAYQLQLGLAKLGAAYTSMDYRLGKEFALLEANGTAKIASLYGSYPLIRSRNNSLYAQINYDSKKFQDKTDATGSVTDKDAKVWLLNLNGDSRDNWAGGGINNYSLTYTSGKIDIRSPLALLIDQLTVNSNGHFNKVGFSAARLQAVAENTTLFGTVSGQWASKNLDVSEKMGLGGVGGVRAYPGGEAYGDQGYVLNLELRQALPAFTAFPGQLQAVAFVDSGRVTLNRDAFGDGENRRTLSGAGLGLTWNGSNGLALKLYYAHKLGNAQATSAPDSAGRVWLQAVKYF